jgi:hypothetical protein
MTAPPPRLTAALDAKWLQVEKWVKAGLDAKSADKKSVVSQLSRALPLNEHGTLLPDGSNPPNRSEYKKRISRDALAALPEVEVTEWACQAREAHLLEVLQALAACATDSPSSYSEEGVLGAQVHGEGGRRLIHLRGDRDVADSLLEQGEVLEVVDVAAAVTNQDPAFAAGYSALLVREYGCPYLNRPNDLTLGWEPANSFMLRLVLEASWRLERANPVQRSPRVLGLG